MRIAVSLLLLPTVFGLKVTDSLGKRIRQSALTDSKHYASYVPQRRRLDDDEDCSAEGQLVINEDDDFNFNLFGSPDDFGSSCECKLFNKYVLPGMDTR